MSRSDVVSENSSSNVLYSTTTWILKDLKLILSSEDDAEGFGGQLAQCLLGFRHSDASVYVFFCLRLFLSSLRLLACIP